MLIRGNISQLHTMCVCVLSQVQLFVTLWTVACQASLSMGFARQLQFPPPGDLPDPGIKLCLLRLWHCQADSLPLCRLEYPYNVPMY